MSYFYRQRLFKYAPDQPRDASGRWTSDAGALEKEFVGRDARFWEIGQDCQIGTTGFDSVDCSGYAYAIQNKLGKSRVKVLGFDAAKTTGASRLAAVAGGHNFALVDGRYIVDPWIVNVAGISDKGVHDLQDPRDVKAVFDIYGDRKNWASP